MWTWAQTLTRLLASSGNLLGLGFLICEAKVLRPAALGGPRLKYGEVF